MLKNIDPLLSADLLFALRSMGHGDELVLVDANFPGDSVARASTHGRVIRTDCTSVSRMAQAILSVFPVDDFVAAPAHRMAVVGDRDEIPDTQAEVQRVIDAAEGRSVPLAAIERLAFYERSKQAYCVVQTAEQRLYGCFVFTMGVVRPPA